jgi:tetratricopeptide (TPR) repeat protein
MTQVDVGKRLRKFRTARGLSQSELAAPVFTHAYVSSIESGRRAASRRAIEHFASKLDLEVDEILTGRPAGLGPRLELDLQEARRLASAGKVDEADAIYANVAREAKRYGEKRLQAFAEEGKALCAERRGRLEDAIELCQAAQELLRGESPTARAPVVARLARCLQMRGDNRYAIYLLEALLVELKQEELTDPSALVLLYGPLALACFEAGLYDQADSAAKEALRLAGRTANSASVAMMYVNVARVQLNKGMYDDAEASLTKAEALFRELDLHTEMGVARLAHGFVLARKGETEEAEAQLQAASEILKTTNSPINEAQALNELGRLRRERGDLEGARALFRRSIELVEGESDIRVLAYAYRELGRSFFDEDPAVAEKNLRSAAELYERDGEKLELAVTYGDLGDLLSKHDELGGCEVYRDAISTIRGIL